MAGVGLVALTQGVLLTGTALGLSGAFASAAPLRDNRPLVLGILVWFLLGYCCYGAMFAAAAAVSRRHAEAQSASFLVVAPLLGAIGVAVPTLVGRQPDRLLRILSVVPFTAPVAMPVRQSLEGVPAAELLAAGGGLVVAAAVFLWFGGLAYTRATLGSGR